MLENKECTPNRKHEYPFVSIFFFNTKPICFWMEFFLFRISTLLEFFGKKLVGICVIFSFIIFINEIIR
jgi:hypothetical protein